MTSPSANPGDISQRARQLRIAAQEAHAYYESQGFVCCPTCKAPLVCGDIGWYQDNEGSCPVCGIEVGSEIEATLHTASHAASKGTP